MARLFLTHCTVDLATGLVEGGRGGRLTPRELQLLEHLAEREGVTVPREALLAVFGYAPQAVSRAVDKAMHSLRARVEARPDEPVHLHTMGGGYRFVRAPTVAVPAERDPFVGRAADLERLATALVDARLLCVTGPAGVGKTRLVLHHMAAHHLAGEQGQSAWFVDLSGASTREEVVHGVGRGLGVSLAGGDELAQLGFALAARGRCVLALDNLEQIEGPAREVLGRWLDAAPEATFLATSRTVLGVPGERVLELEPLPAEQGRELFLVRAEAARSGFCQDHAGDEAIGALVEQLDGLPLAIELAAARTRLLPPAELLARLSDRFRWLGRPGAAPSRHATLRAALDWSWNLLEPWAASALAQLAVFEGGFDLDSAEQVVRLQTGDPWAPDAVQALLDRSLVARRDGGRFDLLVSVREYVASQAHPATEAARARHAAWFARSGTLEALREASRSGTSRDLANLVAAARWAMGAGDATTAALASLAAWRVLQVAGPHTLGVELLEAPLAMPLPDALRARLSSTAGYACGLASQFDAARAHHDLALALARRCGDPQLEAEALLDKAQLVRLPADERAAHTREALALFRRLGDRWGEGEALSSLVVIGAHRLPAGERHALAVEAVAIHRAVGNRFAEAMTQGSVGRAAVDCGRFEEAAAALHEALRAHRDLGYRVGTASTHVSLGSLYKALGRYDDAVHHNREAIREGARIGDRRVQAGATTNLANLLWLAGDDAQALVAYTEAVALHREVSSPRNLAVGLLQLGLAEFRHDRLADAFAHLREALDVAERDQDLHMWSAIQANLGMQLRRLGRPQEAHAAFAAAVERVPERDDGLMSDILLEWARVALALGDARAANERLREAERRMAHPDHPRARIRLLATAALVTGGEAGRARLEQARQLAAQGPPDADIDQMLAEVERELG